MSEIALTSHSPLPFLGDAANVQSRRMDSQSAAPALGVSQKDSEPSYTPSMAPDTETVSATYDDPRKEAGEKQSALEKKQELQVQEEVRRLAARDREVKTHEQAHMAAGGRYAGAASYQFVRGPDGVSYAVSGEVPISTGKAATPEETIAKAQVVRRAALAPAEPSGQDRQVAAQASTMEAEARVELARMKAEEASEGREDEEVKEEDSGTTSDKRSDDAQVKEEPGTVSRTDRTESYIRSGEPASGYLFSAHA